MPLFVASQSTPSRAMGTKFFIILLLALIMSIPGFFIDSLADGRAQAHHATDTFDQAGNHHPPATIFGVRLADSYRSTQRSLKYITLFLGLVFLTYFLFEVTQSRRVHPGQYALVGVAQIVFYLLLLSLAEHTGFDLAFLIAGAATVALFTTNTLWLFQSKKLAQRATVAFSAVYGLIYVLLRLQDYALLVGSVVSFAAVAAAMYLTRNIDWYGAAAIPAAAPMAAASGPRPNERWLD